MKQYQKPRYNIEELPFVLVILCFVLILGFTLYSIADDTPEFPSGPVTMYYTNVTSSAPGLSTATVNPEAIPNKPAETSFKPLPDASPEINAVWTGSTSVEKQKTKVYEDEDPIPPEPIKTSVKETRKDPVDRQLDQQDAYNPDKTRKRRWITIEPSPSQLSASDAYPDPMSMNPSYSSASQGSQGGPGFNRSFPGNSTGSGYGSNPGGPNQASDIPSQNDTLPTRNPITGLSGAKKQDPFKAENKVKLSDDKLYALPTNPANINLSGGGTSTPSARPRSRPSPNLRYLKNTLSDMSAGYYRPGGAPGFDIHPPKATDLDPPTAQSVPRVGGYARTQASTFQPPVRGQHVQFINNVQTNNQRALPASHGAYSVSSNEIAGPSVSMFSNIHSAIREVRERYFDPNLGATRKPATRKIRKQHHR